MTDERKPKLVVELAEAHAPIEKPKGSKLDKFKTKRPDALTGVETLQSALAVHSLSDANDFVRTHPNEEEYWSPEFCFVSVPVKGQKRDLLHLIDEDIALLFLPAKKIIRFRLALATKPYDIFFLCQVPTRNLDNSWNESSVQACERAKRLWTLATSRKEEGYESYKITGTRDADPFPEPKWPSQTLDTLIDVTFTGRQIETEDHPALLRLIGARQQMS